MIENMILKLIENENKKKPLTDKDIAKKVNTTRAYITQFRKEHNILTSNQRRDEILHNDIKKIITNEKLISDNMLSKKLLDIGYDISRYSVTQIRKQFDLNVSKVNVDNAKNVVENVNVEIVENVTTNKVDDGKDLYKINKKNNLREIIGYHGSLRNQVRQAEAAILYPPHGLHTLILGPSGVGKSFFAEAMYKFAINSSNFNNNAPFIVFNCADYAENPQLLLSQLFGYVKGAFTGANTDKIGIVEKANGGILFLDEVHRLPNEGQEILFHLLDKGKYRRLGETENSRTANVMITAATTENPESSLLLTFRRRIPMIINLPSINDRPITERYILIENFFSHEAERVGKEITIKFYVIRSLLLYDCPGNIGQLRSDIQVACAKGFLNSLGNNLAVVIEITDLPDHVPLGILSVASRNTITDDICNDDLVVNPGNISTPKLKDDRYIFPDEIYTNIQKKYYHLEKQGLKKYEINKIIWNKMKFDLNRFAKNIESNAFFSKEELKNIVDGKILMVVENVTNIAKSYIDNLKENFYYCMAVHLNSTYDRLKQGKTIMNSQLEYIKNEYHNEYRVAKILTKEINNSLDIKLPEDEIGFIAMYLKTFSAIDQKISRVSIIVLSHGHVACGMVDVSNKLLGTNLAIGIEMSLDESPQILLKKTIETVKKVNEGKGCLLLVDMGSLVTFGEIITKQTGIPTRIIARVDTVMVLEAVRRALITSDLDEIADAIDGDKSYVRQVKGVKKYLKTIITVCITGVGTALKIKKYLEDIMDCQSENINIIPIGIMNRDSAQDKIKKITEDHNVIAIVGTINPEILDIPFISFQDILKDDAKIVLRNLMGIKVVSPLLSVIDEELIQIRDDLFSKADVIDEMSNLLKVRGNVNEDYVMSIYKREMMGGTIIVGNVAIPHGLPENVKKSSLAIFKLKHFITWENDSETDLIIMIALKENDQEIILKLFDLLSKGEIIEKIDRAHSAKEIANLLLEL
ncbi:sigma 54-interacting transcriptional regulator [Clostridium estertheticum]|uniref:Transcriptional regulator n=1 Tax=Clostridium estertheticum subsp. estertheticum TaxID=1552 RepID=A0A1J0GFI5_9CLOT|nr:sigma 54-interacting transcriptional regulator [Clostridium estertheticum]APC40129.1 transcriptional regulator [Clostridium estertheticum subsp. estertheticum]MBZ9618088.1 sigma 54-interacting transcriptional regulator [Clostridium estertheticum subsp. laramiense]WAG73742.1 sigma 54-interacting transcriptional regulator [Clostridium estertheticum]